MSNQQIAIVEDGQVAELGIEDVESQVAKIQELMRRVMKEGQHYGVIPGTDKPTLLKAGAEKLGFTFRLVPRFDVDEVNLPDGHREYKVGCDLTHASTGAFAGSGVGTCSTMESKYRYRTANRVCPKCGADAIIKGKEEYGGGWLCFAKKGGCGAKFKDDDESIVSQKTGRVENPDIADTYNTVLKMAKKRAHIDAMITACAASDIFTQDVEDMAGASGETVARKTEEETNPDLARRRKRAHNAVELGAYLEDEVDELRMAFNEKHKESIEAKSWEPLDAWLTDLESEAKARADRRGEDTVESTAEEAVEPELGLVDEDEKPEPRATPKPGQETAAEIEGKLSLIEQMLTTSFGGKRLLEPDVIKDYRAKAKRAQRASTLNSLIEEIGKVVDHAAANIGSREPQAAGAE